MKLKFCDSIRGIAILMVILVHTSQKINNLDFITNAFAKYGQMGVQLFFVASAYTLCLSALKKENESACFLKFAIRRYFRIAPAYYLGLALYFVITLINSKIQYGGVFIPAEYNLSSVISHLTFCHGFYPPANNSLVPGGWSIGTEMAFYALFPFLFSFAHVRLKESLKNILIFALTGILFSQLIIAVLTMNGFKISNNNFIYFNLINQLPVFLLGIGYFFMKRELMNKWSLKADLLCFFLFTFIAVGLWGTEITYLFSIIPFISGISFIFLIEIFRKVNFLNHKLLIRIGQVSYSMYLIHFIFAHYITGYLASKIEVVNGAVSLLIFFLFSIATTFGIALLSEKYIEIPSIEVGKKIIYKLDILLLKRNIPKNLSSN